MSYSNQINMTRMKLLALLTFLALGCSDARTVDGGRVDAERVRGLSPLAVPKNLPLIRSQIGNVNVLAPGLNDIQGGLMDKIDNNNIDNRESSAAASTTPYAPTVPEFNDIETLDATIESEAEEPKVAQPKVPEPEVPEHQADEPEDFGPDVFDKENDLVLVMRRMYEALTKRMSLLKNRVSSVEQSTNDILARLTDLDCSDLQTRGQRESGIYTLHMDHNGKRPVEVVCDMETDGGGWTVIQRRSSHSDEVDFNRNWFDYKMGFGNMSSDFWVGLENIFIWTNNRHYEMRIDLTDFDGESSFAHYDHFYIESEDTFYRLHVSGYSGTSGDSLGNDGKADNFTADGMMFTTQDEDHDTSHEINCAKYWNIGGWWFNRCSWANLNGPYREPGEGDGIGINWHMWRNKEYLRSSKIMIRPTRNI